MAGKRDEAKRGVVRRFLRTREGREASVADAARQCACSRMLVTSVLREMQEAGEFPHEPRKVKHAPGGVVEYVPGSVARGGYVYDERGRVVPKLDWLRRVEADPSLMAAVRKTARARRGKSK